jgi:hypothetical protein
MLSAISYDSTTEATMNSFFRKTSFLLISGFLVAAMALPALAQWERWHLSPQDQQRFDSYYSRWREYRERNDRDQIESMENRMRGIYRDYNIPGDTPFWRVASNAREYRHRYEHKLSPHDQARFDSYFSRWQEYRQQNNREQVESMEKRMRDIYAHYGIPANTPFFMVTSNARDEDWDDWERRR